VQIAAAIRHTPMEMQSVCEVGRDVSAIFGAMAAAAICLGGYVRGGILGAIFLGLSALFCSSLVVYSHYFKEDAALAMGTGLVFLGICCVGWAAKRPVADPLAVVFLALCCAIAASAKYAGAVFLVPGLIAIFLMPVKDWRDRIAGPIGFLILFCFFALAINYRALITPWDFKGGFGFESEHGLTDHFGLTMHQPNTYFLFNLPRETGWPIFILGAAAIPLAIITWRKRNRWDWLAISLGPMFLIALSFSIIPFTRYLLPVVVLTQAMAGLCALWVVGMFPKSGWRCVATGVMLAAILLACVPRCVSVQWQFAHDSRDRLRAWMIATLPPGTKVVGDFYSGMVVRSDGMHGSDVIGNDIHVEEAFAATHYGPVNLLRFKGISYLVVTDAAYERYFVPQVYPIPEEQKGYDYKKQYYVNLFARYKLAWESIPNLNLHAFTNPAIYVFRVDGK
jgi:hypothetical protein